MIVYILKKDNSRVDALSCRYNIARTKLIIDSVLLKVNTNRLLELAKMLN